MSIFSRFVEPIARELLERRCQDLSRRCEQLYDENVKLRADAVNPDIGMKDQQRIIELEVALKAALDALKEIACTPHEQAVFRTSRAILENKK